MINTKTGKNLRVNVAFRPNPPQLPVPIDPRELKSLGFDCYALDKIECPDGLLPYLRSDVALHRTVSDRPFHLPSRGCY